MEVNLQNETKQIVGVKEEITFDAEAELHPLEYVDMALNFKFEIRDKYDPDHVYDLPSFRDEHEASFEFSDHLEDHIKQELEDYKSDELTTEPTYCSTPVAKGIKRIRPRRRLFSDDPLPVRRRLFSDDNSSGDNLDSLMQRPPVTAQCERPTSDTKLEPFTLPWCDYVRRLLRGCDIRAAAGKTFNEYSRLKTPSLTFDDKLEVASSWKDNSLSPPLPDPLPLHWAPKVKAKIKPRCHPLRRSIRVYAKGQASSNNNNIDPCHLKSSNCS